MPQRRDLNTATCIKEHSRCRFYAFQFQLEELVDGLEELQAAFSTLVRVMPRHCGRHHHTSAR